MAKTVAAATLGCKVNLYETEAVLAAFAARGWQTADFGEQADVYVINTCTVTNTADRKSRQLIAQARRKNPRAVVAAVGCFTQASPEAARALGADVVAGTADRAALVDLVENFTAPITRIAEQAGFEPLSVARIGGRTRAFLKIQDGCENFCAYCAIPYVRGQCRSRPLPGVAAEAAKLAAAGYREIVLAGVHVASYGKDLGGKDLPGADLKQALSLVCAVPGVERVRLSSIEPSVVTDDFVSFIANSPKICNHFHLSLQSGCDKTLAAMNRKYSASGYKAAVERLRAALPGVSVTTDVIVGFPGETEADFAESRAFCEALRLSRLHVFPYSPKRGTAAAAMPNQLPERVKRERAVSLLALSAELRAAFLSGLTGQEHNLLAEKNDNGTAEGLTGNYANVTARSHAAPGGIIRVRITGNDGFTAFGEEIAE